MLRSDLGELQDSEIERPMVRLLPYFDSFLLGHEEKDHLVDKRHRKLVYRDQGWVSATLLVDGRTRGVWTYTQGRTHLKVDVQLFAPLPKGAASAVRLEANHLGRFLGCNDTRVTIH